MRITKTQTTNLPTFFLRTLQYCGVFYCYERVYLIRMKKRILTFLLILCANLIAATMAVGQTDTVINGKKYKAVDESSSSVKEKKGKYHPLDSTFVINNKKFKYYNNWLNLGGGPQQNLAYDLPLGFQGGLDYNFHIKHHYFQAGAFISGDKIGFYNNYQIHAAYGKRFEDKDFHAGAFIGLSFSSGRAKVDSVYTRPYKQPGLYAEAHVVKKVTYDVGIGLSIFGDWNSEQSMIGVRFILYFSSAYQGLKKKY